MLRVVNKSKLHDYEGAIADQTKVIESDSFFYLDALHERGCCQIELKKYAEALHDLTILINQGPDFAEAYYRRGLVLIELGDKNSGCSDLKKAKRLGYTMSSKAINKHCKLNFGTFLNLFKEKRSKELKSHLKSLNARDTTIAIEAIKALREVKEPSIVMPLVKKLKAKNLEVRIEALKTLANVGDFRAVKYLVETLEDENHEIRNYAEKSLSMIEDIKVLMPLADGLRDRNEAVQSIIARIIVLQR